MSYRTLNIISFTCLPVRKDSAIVTLKDIINETECSLLVDVGLGGLRPEYIIEGKVLSLILLVGLVNDHLLVFPVHLHNICEVCQ